MAKQFLYCSNIIPGLKKLGGKPVRRVMSGQGPVDFSSQHCDPVFSALSVSDPYLSLFTINILDPEADALLHAMLFCHAPPYESISKLSFFIGNVDMPACLVKVFQFLRFYAPFSSLSLDPVAGQILAALVPESGNTIVIRMPFHGFLLCILVMVILVKYWDLVKSTKIDQVAVIHIGIVCMQPIPLLCRNIVACYAYNGEPYR